MTLKHFSRFIILAAIICWFSPLKAAEIVTATITFTSSPANDDTITINAGVRTWKDTVATAATQIQRTANAPGTNATNLWSHLLAYPVTGLRVAQTDTNVVTLTTLPTTTVAVSFSDTYAAVVYTTNTLTALVAVRVPFSSIPDPAGTNIAYQANQLLAGLSTYGTNFFRLENGDVALPIFTTVGDTDSGIYFPAANTIGIGSFGTNRLTIADGYVQWNGSLYGTNGTLGLMILNNPTSTNLVNYGNAISSPGSGSGSEQFGADATATGLTALAVGNNADASSTLSTAIGANTTASAATTLAAGRAATASGTAGTAVGDTAQATGQATTAVGATSLASGEGATALGTEAIATALQATALGAIAEANHTNTVAIGYSAVANYSGSVAIGASAASTAASQIRLGASGNIVSIPGNLDVDGTIETAKIGELSLQRLDITSLTHSSVNTAVSISTNAFLRVSSGPTAAFTIGGITGGTDGRQVTIYNSLAYNMTIANESGSEGIAANRITTLSGSDYTTTTYGAVTLIYDTGASRWILISTVD